MIKHLLILFIFPAIAFAQQPGAHSIIIKNTHSERDNYITLLKAFMSEGFEIDKKDDLFHTVTFEPIKYNYGYGKRTDTHWNYLIVSASVAGDSIVVRMQNKRSGRLKRETIYDPDYPETVAAFDRVTSIVGRLGDLSFPILENHKERKPLFRDDVYGI